MSARDDCFSPDARSLLVDELSARVQRAFPHDTWQKLFVARSGSVKFGGAQRILLCVECPTGGPMTRTGVVAALSRAAKRYHALLDPCADDFAFLSFSDPVEALEMAVALQRLLPGARLRMGISGGRCQLAVCQLEQMHFVVLLGWQRAHAEALTVRASPGTLQLEPQVYPALQAYIAEALGSCVLMTEYSGTELAEISLTLPPDPSAVLSTFAGLGLT